MMNIEMIRIAVLASILGACTTARLPSPPTEPYSFESASGEVVEAELGELVVPENRDDPSSRTIRLRFVRFPATGPDPGSPIVYLAGGPGGSGIEAARGSRFPLFMALRRYGDVIAFDQRGTGRSEPDLACDEPYAVPFDRPLDPTAAGRILAAAARACADRLAAGGVDLAGYDTLDSAADLEDLRRALGAERMTLWGISYGTHLALATIKEYPGSVDRAILAGLEPLRHTWKLPSDQQEQLEEIGRLAAADPAVRDAIPDLVGSIARLLERLEREPASALLVDPTDGTAGEMAVGAADLRVVLAGFLTGPETFRLMPDLVHRLEGGDWTALALLAVPNRMGEAPGLMSLAMDCASGASEDWLARIRREAPATLLGDAINFPAPEVCEGVPVADLGDDFRAPAGSEIPVLLISGTLDGRTPVRNGDYVAASFPDSSHLVIEGAGHSDPLFLSSPEILATVERFLAGEAVGDRRIAALPFGFVAPREVVSLPAGAGERYAGSYRTPEGDPRHVIPGGPDVLYSIRRGRPLVLRPLSETEFFYEGITTRVEFELDATGRATAMILYTDGPEGERSPRIE